MKYILFILLCSIQGTNFAMTAPGKDTHRTTVAAAGATAGVGLAAAAVAGATVGAAIASPLLIATAPVALTVYAISYLFSSPQEQLKPSLTQEQQKLLDALNMASGKNQLAKIHAELTRKCAEAENNVLVATALKAKSAEAERELERNRIKLEQTRRQADAQKMLNDCFVANYNTLDRGPSGRPTTCEQKAMMLGMAAGTTKPVDATTKTFNDIRGNK